MHTRLLLLPFSIIYSIVSSIRNIMYDEGILKSYSPPVYTEVVGNLSTGGTGKTPFVIHRIKEALSEGNNIGFLSRGYGRKTKGFVQINNDSSASEVGDEPLMIYGNFNERITAAVCESRVEGIKQLLQINPAIEYIILDDAFQHRSLRAHYYTLLTTYAQPYYNDYVLPAGNLREPSSGSARANRIIVTKCPSILSEEENKIFTQKLKPKAGQEVFFYKEEYGKPISFFDDNKTDEDFKAIENIILFTGIANATTYQKHLNSLAKNIKMLSYPDHHFYTAKDMKAVIDAYKNSKGKSIIITTEKDFYRLRHTKEMELLKAYPVYYYPLVLAEVEK